MSQRTSQRQQTGRASSALEAELTRVRRIEAILVTEREVLARCVRGDPLEKLLDHITGTIIEQSAHVVPAILLLEGGRLRYASAPTLPPEYIAGVDDTPIGPMVRSCGTAAHRNAPVYVSDIASDPKWSNYQALALRHQLRACWSTPIRASDGQVLGTFALYHREPKLPSDEDLSIIDLLSRTTGLVLEWYRTEKRRRTLLTAVLEATENLRAASDPERFEGELAAIERNVRAALDHGAVMPAARAREYAAIAGPAGE